VTNKELDKNAARRLAIIRHAQEVTGNVARPAGTTGSARRSSTGGCAGLDSVLAGRRCVNQGGDVAGDVSPLHGDLQSARQNAVNLEHGGGCQTLSFQAGVEALDVLGGEPVQPVFAQPRNDPVADLRRVRGFRVDLRMRRDAMVLSQVSIHCPTVTGRPTPETWPLSRVRSSSRTLRVTAASVRALRCLRSGDPSSLMPTVAQPCHQPSLPR
jgi:hypothetical protein